MNVRIDWCFIFFRNLWSETVCIILEFSQMRCWGNSSLSGIYRALLAALFHLDYCRKARTAWCTKVNLVWNTTFFFISRLKMRHVISLKGTIVNRIECNEEFTEKNLWKRSHDCSTPVVDFSWFGILPLIWKIADARFHLTLVFRLLWSRLFSL